MNKLTIKGRMTDLNSYIDAERRNKHMAAKIKKEETERVAWACIEQKIPVYTGKIHILYTFYMDNNRQDEDNLLIYVKFINDGLVSSRRIKSDGKRWLHIAGIFFSEQVGEAKTIIELYEDKEHQKKLLPFDLSGDYRGHENYQGERQIHSTTDHGKNNAGFDV